MLSNYLSTLSAIEMGLIPKNFRYTGVGIGILPEKFRYLGIGVGITPEKFRYLGVGMGIGIHLHLIPNT